MARIVVENQPIRFLCDAPNCTRECATPEHQFMKAFHYMQRKGWKAYVEEGVWQHACPHHYVDWCRRAGVEPYESSNFTTYDEVKAEEGCDDGEYTLEPDWWVEQERRRQEAAARAAKNQAPRKRKRNRKSRQREKIAERRRLGYEEPIDDSDYYSGDPYETSVMFHGRRGNPRSY